MAISVKGVGALNRRLESISERTDRELSLLLKKAAMEMKHRVEQQTHRDTGALESAIRLKEARNGINGRRSYEIFVDPEKRRRVKRKGSWSRQRVATYAKRLETGEWGSRLGPRSRAKNREIASNGMRVGPGFFSRSASYVYDRYIGQMRRVVKRIARRRR